MRLPVSLATMPLFVVEAIAGANAATRARRGPDGTFSLTEQACHLRDLEREGYLIRARRILAEKDPHLADFQGDVIARQRDYASQDARLAARHFAAARAELLALLEPVDAGQSERTGIFLGRRITLADLVAMIEEHDAGHRDEIAALVRSGQA